MTAKDIVAAAKRRLPENKFCFGRRDTDGKSSPPGGSLFRCARGCFYISKAYGQAALRRQKHDGIMPFRSIFVSLYFLPVWNFLSGDEDL